MVVQNIIYDVNILIFPQLRENFGNTSLSLDSVGEVLANISQRILLANVSLGELERKVDSLQASATTLKDKAINLQESNVEGEKISGLKFLSDSKSLGTMTFKTALAIQFFKTFTQKLDKLSRCLKSYEGSKTTLRRGSPEGRWC